MQSTKRAARVLLGVLTVAILASVTGARADAPEGVYEWYFGDRYPLFVASTPLQAPAAAVAADGSRLEISGYGLLTVDGGETRAAGSGHFTITWADQSVSTGRWTAREIRDFTEQGPYPMAPFDTLGYRIGVIRVEVSLDGIGTGVLTLFCSAEMEGEHVEGVRLRAGGTTFEPVGENPTGLRKAE